VGQRLIATSQQAFRKDHQVCFPFIDAHLRSFIHQFVERHSALLDGALGRNGNKALH
jgi:hypothetical protein